MAVPRLVVAVLVVAELVGATPVSADGTTLYVDQSSSSCSDSGSGTIAQPFCTIGAAAAGVTAGQTVQVAGGTYPAPVTVSSSGTSTAPITFTAAPGATVTLSGQANGFAISGRSWVTVNGFSVTGTSGYGINVSSSSHITITGNHITGAGQQVSGMTRSGIRFSGVTDSLISGNTSDHNSDHGILLTSSSTRNEVRGNWTFNNAEGYQRAAAGIRLYSSPGNTVDGNISHDNEDSGIESYTGSNNTLLYDNVTYNNGDHGIDNLQTTGQRVIANTVYNNVTAGINLEGGSTGATVANNISVDNGINSPRTSSNIRVASDSTAGTTMDHDVVNLRSPDTLLIWGSGFYSSLSAFQTATGQESHGIQADPKWKSPGTGDFHLVAGSPAIDAANSDVSGQPDTDIEGRARVDDPATPNTGAGTRPYDDRGAYEYAPSELPPAAALSVTPSSGQPPLTVTADASASTDTDSTPIATYSFDFGDGSPATGPQPGATASHTYASLGVFTVTATVTDTAGLSSTATATATVTDAPAVTLADPGSPLRGSVTLTASATDPDGVQSVAIERRPSGGGTWTAICTDAGAPFACAWNTTDVADADYDLRAVATDTLGDQSTSAVVAARRVDNTAPRALDIQGANGGTAARLDAGDRIVFTYSEQIAAATILTGWTGAATTVTVRVTNSGTLDRLSVYDGANSTRLALLSTGQDLQTNANHVGGSGARFSATMVQSGAQVTITIGTLLSGSTRTGVTTTTAMVWTPSASATDLAGNPAAGTAATESGPADADF